MKFAFESMKFAREGASKMR